MVHLQHLESYLVMHQKCSALLELTDQAEHLVSFYHTIQSFNEMSKRARMSGRQIECLGQEKHRENESYSNRWRKILPDKWKNIILLTIKIPGVVYSNPDITEYMQWGNIIVGALVYLSTTVQSTMIDLSDWQVKFIGNQERITDRRPYMESSLIEDEM